MDDQGLERCVIGANVNRSTIERLMATREVLTGPRTLIIRGKRNVWYTRMLTPVTART